MYVEARIRDFIQMLDICRVQVSGFDQFLPFDFGQALTQLKMVLHRLNGIK